MANGYQIRRKDGKLYASPNFTPHILYSIEDFSISQPTKVYKTTVDYSDSALVFFYSMSSLGAFFFVSNVDGKLALTISTQENHTIRVYIFDNKVRYLPNRGVFVYNGGKVVYSGNCLPLVIKRISTAGLIDSTYPKGTLAVKPGFGNLVATGLGSNQWLWISTCWGANTSGGIIQAPVSSGVDQIPSLPSDPEILYIDRTIYDKYRVSGIGY